MFCFRNTAWRHGGKVDKLEDVRGMRRLLLIAFAVLLAAIAVLQPFYRHKREEQRAQQLSEASAAIRSSFQGYAAALTKRDFPTAYGYFGAEFRAKTPLERFREEQLKYGVIVTIEPKVIQSHFQEDFRRTAGFIVAMIQYQSNVSYFTFKFEKEQGDWKIVSVERGRAF